MCREPLPHLSFDVELLGDCDKIINQICLMLGGEEWREPIRGENLTQHTGLPESLISERQSKGVSEKEVHQDQGSNEESKMKEDKSAEDDTSAREKDKSPEVLRESQSSEDQVGMSSSSTIEPVENETCHQVNDKSNADSDSDGDDEGDDWKMKSLSDYIPSGQYLYLPPSRYVFPGAEVYPVSSEDEDGSDDEQEEDTGVEGEREDDARELSEDHKRNQNE